MANKYLKKDDAFKTLDTINMWINNCDTKASVVLGCIGVVSSILLSSDIVRIIKQIIEKAFSNFNDVGMFFYNLFFIAGISFCILGVLFIVLCITPKIYLGTVKKMIPKCLRKKLGKFIANKKKKKLANSSKAAQKSIMFYGSIALKSYKDYMDRIEECSLEYDDVMKDLVFQIHSAACICNAKFKRFKVGLIFFVLGIIICLTCILIGYYCIIH